VLSRCCHATGVLTHTRKNKIEWGLWLGFQQLFITIMWGEGITKAGVGHTVGEGVMSLSNFVRPM
jgi:hypothetical protein